MLQMSKVFLDWHSLQKNLFSLYAADEVLCGQNVLQSVVDWFFIASLLTIYSPILNNVAMSLYNITLNDIVIPLAATQPN